MTTWARGFKVNHLTRAEHHFARTGVNNDLPFDPKEVGILEMVHLPTLKAIIDGLGEDVEEEQLKQVDCGQRAAPCAQAHHR